MTLRIAAGLALAISSACAINWGFFIQHDAASAMPPLSLRRPFHSLGALFGNRRWLTGFVGGIGGWGLYIVALSLAPLSTVQAASAGGIGLLALLVARTTKVAPTRRESAGIAAAVGGLLLLGVSLAGAHIHAHAVSSDAVAVWTAASALAAAAIAVIAARLRAPAAGLGAASGILYAGGDVATKAAFATPHHIPFLITMGLCHGLAFVALQRAFQRGGALETAGISNLLMNALPIAAGIALFHDGVPSGVLGVFRVGSFAGILAAAVLLARAEPPEGERGERATPVIRAPAAGTPR